VLMQLAAESPFAVGAHESAQLVGLVVRSWP
jgi:hypothetical protein